MKLFNSYITYKMALKLLGAKQDQNTRIYRILESHDIETIRIGNMNLLNRKQFCEAAGIADSNRVRWPLHIAVMKIDEVMTAEDASETLGVSVRHIYNLARNRTLLMYDLSEWGGHRVLYGPSVEREKKYRDAVKKARVAKITARGSRAERNRK